MNRKTALILLGAVCLFALVNQSSAAKGDPKPATDVQNDDTKEEGRGGRWKGHGGFDFRKEVETIFDKYGVDTKIRDNILNDIKERMETLHKAKGFRKRRRQNKDESADQTADPIKA